jgi:hypothetical protein
MKVLREDHEKKGMTMNENKKVVEDEMATPYEKPSKVSGIKSRVKGIPGFVKKHGKSFAAGFGSAIALAIGGALLAKKTGGVENAIQDVTDTVTDALPFDEGPEA